MTRMSQTTTLAAAGLLSMLPLAIPHPARADAAVNGSLRTDVLDCGGGDASVNGDGNRLIFTGTCRSLRINGLNNVVQVNLIPGGSLSIAGDGNRVAYTPITPAPAVATQGSNDEILVGLPAEIGLNLTPPPPPSPALAPVVVATPPAVTTATLILDGEMQNRDISCAGQSVLIRGSNGSFTLRGGCLSVTVQGRADTVTAELVPGAHVDFGGDADTLNYTLTMAGPPPVISVVPGSRVTQVSRAGSATYVTEQ